MQPLRICGRGFIPEISKSARSCGTGFIREGVGAVSETVGACPGLFVNKFAPTIAKSTRSCGTGFIREDVGSAGETFGACPGLFANKFAPMISKSARSCGTGFIGKASVPSSRHSEPVPASSRMNSLPQFRKRRDPVGPDSSGRRRCSQRESRSLSRPLRE
jgi:hypothetical protein